MHTESGIFFDKGKKIWKSKTPLEKCLTLIVLLLDLVVIVAVVYRSYVRYTRPQEERYCLTETCITTAASLVSSIDRNVDPCDDFYQFACGNWIKENPIPDGKSSWNSFAKLGEQNQLVMKNALEKPFEELKSKAEKKAKLYYMSCMDSNETIESLGSKPMLELLKEVGGWSIDDSFEVEKWNLQTTLQMLQNRYNTGGLFSWAVEEDPRNSSLHIIQVNQVLTLQINDPYLDAMYLEYMTEIGVLLGGERNRTKSLMKDITDFETRLGEISIPADERRDVEKMYNLMTVAELQDLAPFINWERYFSDALSLVKKKITDKEKVVVYAPKYLANLTIVLKEYMNTSDGNITLNNYLVWQTVRSMTACLSRPFRDAYKGLKKALFGTEGGEESWRYCVTDTNNVLGFALGAMYVREVFQGKSKLKAQEMINSVRTAFKKNLKELKWMDKETRELTEAKADAITDMIGFPDYILDPKQLDEKYKDLEVSENQYFLNNINVQQYNLRQNFKKLGQPVNRTRWGITPSTINAYYTPNRNQIVFPAGILQAPFYDVRHQQALNFGAMGAVMGHELTHAFDDQGRKYDKYGNMHQWWNNKTIEKFKEQTECVVKQYSSYHMNNKYINGKQTLGENIADNGGLKAAFRAFIDWAAKNKEELPLPAVNLTHKQLFFLSFAQVWCSASTEEATNFLMEIDTHATPKFRVIGSLSNSPEFAENFNCRDGSKMNPKNKCVVW